MKRTPSPRDKRALATLAASALVALGCGLVAGTPASAGSNDPCTGSYGWPVKPFDRQHPIRGNFADPRTVFAGKRSARTLLEGGGTFSFHQGVDISAPDGSAVYPVAPGTVTFAKGQRVTVRCGNGRAFQYWHISPSVRVGQRVETGTTVLGAILPKREHVHLTQLEDGRAVNPQAPGHLTPYRDSTAPKILGIEIRGVGAKARQAGAARGRVTFVAEALDVPALAVPGRWRGFPVTPACIAWRLERGGRVVLRGAARDAGITVPRNDRFWRAFARGTHQNWPIFHGRKFQFVPGTYLFRVSPGRLDTRQLRNGAYALVVTAKDTAGNRGTATLHFTIDNGSDL